MAHNSKHERKPWEERPLVAREVLIALHKSRSRTRGKSTRQVARMCGVCSPDKYEYSPPERRAVEEAESVVEAMLGDMYQEGWLACDRSGRVRVYRLRSREVRAARQHAAWRATQRKEVAAALGAKAYNTTIYIDGLVAERAHALLRASGLLPGTTDALLVQCSADEADELLATLDSAHPAQARLALMLEGALARQAAQRLGQAVCTACAGAGSIGHTDIAGFHRWQCARCGGNGIEPEHAPAATTADEQRVQRGYTCCPDCHGVQAVITQNFHCVPEGWAEVQRCDVCQLYTSDEEAALELAGAGAWRVNTRTGTSRRIADGPGGWAPNVPRACVVPVGLLVQAGLHVPGEG